MSKNERKKIIIAILLLVAIAVASMTVLANVATDPDMRASSIERLDKERNQVLALTGVITATSALITVLPGDMATPVAEKLTDISGYLLLVLCAIYLEKYLLIVTGTLAFKILIPIACLLWGIGIFRKEEWFEKMAAKLVLFGLALFFLIPASLMVDGAIEKAYKTDDKINVAIEEGQNTNDHIQEVTGTTSENSGEAVLEKDDSKNKKGKKSLNYLESAMDTLESTMNAAKSALKTVVAVTGSAASDILEKAKATVNNFVEAVAVMLVTACIMPIMVLFLFTWLIKIFLNIDVDMKYFSPVWWMNRRDDD